MRGRSERRLSAKCIPILCVSCFCLGILFTNRSWVASDPSGQLISRKRKEQEYPIRAKKSLGRNQDIMVEVTKTHEAIQSLEKTMSSLQMELSATRGSKDLSGAANGTPLAMESSSQQKKKAFVVIGINTAFSSRKRRDSLRETWMPQGEELQRLEREKGIVVRFMIGHRHLLTKYINWKKISTKRSMQRMLVQRELMAYIFFVGSMEREYKALTYYRAIASENSQHNDFIRLDHIEGYHELSAKTKTFFSTAVAKWDAQFYVKVDDDVHVNLGMLVTTLTRHRSKPRAYIGCMKSGPVLSDKNVRYHEPEYWKFGEEGSKYFRHATGQIYAITKDLATYISINQPILHKYANEDVSLGAWFIGLDVDHIDERNMCCGTPPDCEWKAQAGNVCIASFDWSCSGICKSVENIKYVHKKCGEEDGALWRMP